ncbi:Uncharacterised protein [Vibrio cholerae]|nr:Uncharacterised protein [Vibrio cholerae]
MGVLSHNLLAERICRLSRFNKGDLVPIVNRFKLFFSLSIQQSE